MYMDEMSHIGIGQVKFKDCIRLGGHHYKKLIAVIKNVGE